MKPHFTQKEATGTLAFLGLFGLLTLFASSCSTDVNGGMQNRPVTGTTGAATTSPYSTGFYNNDIQPDGSTTDNGYNCPESPNVVPDANSDAIFTDRWTACKSLSDTTDIEFQGTATESQVCVFPAETADSAATPVLGINGLPWFQCVAPSQLGAYVSFPGATYNAVFIVEFTDAAAMQTCLYSDTYYSCPPYSYGQFR